MIGKIQKEVHIIVLLTELLVGGSALYTGARVYKKNQKKKKLAHFLHPSQKSEAGVETMLGRAKSAPSTYGQMKSAVQKLHVGGSALYAEVRACQKKKKLAHFLDPSRKSEAGVETTFGFIESVSSAYGEMKSAIQKFHTVKIQSLFGEAHHQQLKEISSDEDQHETSKANKEVNRCLAVALTSLGLATAGALVYSPLSLLSVPGIVYTSFPVFKDAYKSLKEGKIGIDVLSSITILTCVFSGYYVIFSLAVVSYSISSKLLLKVKKESKKNVIDVFRQQPRSVWVLMDGVEVEVPFEELTVDDIVVVGAGEVLPADGVITDGMASIDQHILTGESQPAEKGVGDPVFALTVLLSGRICVRIEKAGEETIVAKIGQILNDTADFKSAAQLRAEIMADKTVLPTLMVSGLALPFLGPYAAAAITNAHFKYKMGIVAPISILNFLNMMSQNQILVKDGRMLDLLNQVDTVVFDKTGTLTEEQPHIGQIHTCSEYDENTILAYAAAAEHKQAHPIAKAILQASEARQLRLPEINDTEYKVGYGLTVEIDNQLVRVGSVPFMEMESVAIPPSIKKTQKFCYSQGHSLVMVAVNNSLIGAIELHATIRPEAKQIINQLGQRRNIKSMYIISGDHEAPTRSLAAELGIEHYFAQTLPEKKADIIEQLQAEGKFICFVGDGINDSIALKKSQVSVSLRGASTVAMDTAQIVLMDESLNQLARLFDFAQEFEANLKVGFTALLTSTILGMGGVVFLHFGLVHTVILGHTGLLAGVSNAMRPLLGGRQKKSKTAPDDADCLNAQLTTAEVPTG